MPPPPGTAMAWPRAQVVSTAPPTLEKGYVTRASNWWTTDEAEQTPELRWPMSVDVYDRMRRTDAQIASVLRAVTLPIMRTVWRLEPAGARDEVVAHCAQDLGLPIVGDSADVAPPRRGKFSWREHLRMALLCLPFGHSFFEQVATIDDAGLAHLAKLGPRLQRTIAAITVADDGGLVSIDQWAGAGANRRRDPIPVNRLVAYVNDQEGGNWLGMSLLRPAYKNWLLKDRLLRTQAQTIERNGMGIPLYTGADGEESLTKGTDIAKAWRSGAGAGAGIPFGATLRLVGVEGTLPDADPAIRYHDEQIARAVLAHFLNLGTQTGSWALGSTFADFFTLALQAVAEQIADVATTHVVEDLVDWNWGPDEPAPRIVFDEIGSRLEANAMALKALVDAGIVLPDRVTEEAVRQMFGLPAKGSPIAPPVPPA